MIEDVYQWLSEWRKHSKPILCNPILQSTWTASQEKRWIRWLPESGKVWPVRLSSSEVAPSCDLSTTYIVYNDYKVSQTATKKFHLKLFSLSSSLFHSSGLCAITNGKSLLLLFHLPASTYSFTEKVSHISEQDCMNWNTWKREGKCFIVCLSFTAEKSFYSEHSLLLKSWNAWRVWKLQGLNLRVKRETENDYSLKRKLTFGLETIVIIIGSVGSCAL